MSAFDDAIEFQVALPRGAPLKVYDHEIDQSKYSNKLIPRYCNTIMSASTSLLNNQINYQSLFDNCSLSQEQSCLIDLIIVEQHSSHPFLRKNIIIRLPLLLRVFVDSSIVRILLSYSIVEL
jgi:hypothetical protein